MLKALYVNRTALVTMIGAMALLLAGCGTQTTTHSQMGGQATAPPVAETVANSGPLAGLRVTKTYNAVFSSLPASAENLRLENITFISTKVGWAAGSRCGGTPRQCRGVLLHTTDGGGTWQAAPFPGGGATFLNDNFGWTSDGESLYVSGDGGATWVKKKLPIPSGPNIPPEGVRVSFADSADGWLLATGGNCATHGQCGAALYATKDGGNSWTLLEGASMPPQAASILPLGTYTRMGYLGGGSGYLVENMNPGSVMVTNDNGAHWQSQTLGDGAGGPGPDAAIAPSGAGWALGQDFSPATNQTSFPVYVTGDGGSAWHQVATLNDFPVGISPAKDGKSGWLLSSRSFPGNGSACGAGNCSSDVTVISADGTMGQNRQAGNWQIQQIVPLDSRQAWAVAVNPSDPSGAQTIIHTADGGRTWQVQYRTTAAIIPTGSWGFWNRMAGWAQGTANQPSAFLRTTAGGRTWEQAGTIPLTAGSSINGMAFPDPAHGWIEEDHHRLLTTADGGGTWQAVTFKGDYAFANLQGFGFTGPTQGWALGMIGADITQKAYQCKRQAALAPGKGGLGGLADCLPFFQPQLYRTGDGGQTWNPMPALAGVRFESLSFSSALVGWAVAQLSGQAPPGQTVLLTTGDGGKTWRQSAALNPTAGEDFLPQMQAISAGGKGVWLLVTPMTGSFLYGSADGGKTWTLINLPSGVGTDSLAQAFFLDPSQGWLKTDGGLYRTTDGGRHWDQMQAF